MKNKNRLILIWNIEMLGSSYYYDYWYALIWKWLYNVTEIELNGKENKGIEWNWIE